MVEILQDSFAKGPNGPLKRTRNNVSRTRVFLQGIVRLFGMCFGFKLDAIAHPFVERYSGLYHVNGISPEPRKTQNPKTQNPPP